MSQRILVVEDSATQREFLVELLVGAGYVVEVAPDGEAGIARFDSAQFDIVISDIMMPGGVDGYELCRRIKVGTRRTVPVMLLTSLADPLDIINGLDCGADNFLTKPFEPAHLLERVQQLLATRESRTTRRLQLGVDVFLLGKKFTISAEREQILDLLISTFEDAVLQNRALRRREEQLERSRRSLEGLYSIARGLAEGSTEEEVAAIALERAMQLPGVRAGWVSLVDGDSQFRMVASRGLPRALAQDGALEGLCTCRRMLLEGALDAPVNIAACPRLAGAPDLADSLRDHAAIPLISGGRAVGVMNLAGSGTGAIAAEDLRLLAGVGSQLATAIERTRLVTQLERRIEERTASLRSEVEVRERRERERDEAVQEQLAMMEAIPDLIYQLDTQSHLVRWNRRLEVVAGRTSAELHGRSALDLIAPESRARVVEAIAGALATGYSELEADLLTADGETIPYHFTAVPLHSEHGEVTGLTGVGRDLTRYKKLELQLRQSQKLESIGRLASGIAHDFNNLLTAITGFTQLLLDDAQSTASQRADLREVLDAAERAGGLTRQLLAFSRQQVLAPRVLNVNETVYGMERMLQRIIGDDVELRAALAAELGSVLVDPGQLEQVIVNLVVNARDAMARGGRVTIETADVELDAAYAHEHVDVTPGHYVMLAVSDTGEGMSAETQASIFEPFFTTKGPGKGTGLGLATVRGVVEQSGGNVWVYSELGVGSTFRVYLPRIDELPSGPSVRLRTTTRVDGTETLLVVDDNEAVRRLVVTVLRANSYAVLEAPHPHAALALCAERETPIDLLVTDIVMPGMNGRELFEQLSARQPGLRVLFTSGYSEDTVRHGVLAAEVEYLAKPFTPQALLQSVRRVLDGE